MDAKKIGVTYGKAEDLLRILQKGNRALALVGEKNRRGLLAELEKAFEAFKDRVSFQVLILKPASFAQFLTLQNPTQAMFNQLASEIPWWDLLDQIEETCFLQSPTNEKARPFIGGLWRDEVARDPFKPPAGWKYLPVEEAVEAYRKLFGSSLRADSVLNLAKQVKPRQESEGVAIWPKLSTIAKLFGISRNPLEDTEEGYEAYAKIVELFIPEVGKAYTKAYPQFPFKNWREGELTAKYVRLAPAGQKAWQVLEKMTDDDFVIAVAGANTGSLYAGYSVRHSRIKIVLAGDQFLQDCIMVGGTIVIQPDRLTKFEHLAIDCLGTKYAPGAGGGFSGCLCFSWPDGGLHFDGSWAGVASRSFGSASGFLG